MVNRKECVGYYRRLKAPGQGMPALYHYEFDDDHHFL